MTDCTVAAPVRATKAPARAKSAPPERQPDPPPQWLELGLQHTRHLCELLYTLVDADENNKAQGLVQELVEAAESHLYNIATEDSYINVSTDGVLQSQINMVAVMLEAAWYAAEHGPLDYLPPLPSAVIPSAIAYAKDLADALLEAPLTDKFCELNRPSKTAGARPQRNQPAQQKEDKDLGSASAPERRVIDQIESALHYATTLGHLLYDELAEPRSLSNDVNDARSPEQRQFALLDGLQAKLEEMRRVVDAGGAA